MIGVILLILAAAGVAKYLSAGDESNDIDNRDEPYAFQARTAPRVETRYSGSGYRGYRFDKETGRLDED